MYQARESNIEYHLRQKYGSTIETLTQQVGFIEFQFQFQYE